MIPSLKSLLFAEQTKEEKPTSPAEESLKRIADAMIDNMASSFYSFKHDPFLSSDILSKGIRVSFTEPRTKASIRFAAYYPTQSEPSYRLYLRHSDGREIEKEYGIKTADEAVDMVEKMIKELEQEENQLEAVRPMFKDMFDYVERFVQDNGIPKFGKESTTPIGLKEETFFAQGTYSFYSPQTIKWIIKMHLQMNAAATGGKPVWYVKLSLSSPMRLSVPDDIWSGLGSQQSLGSKYIQITDNAPQDTYELKMKLGGPLKALASLNK